MARQTTNRRPGRPPAEEGDSEATRRTLLKHAWEQFNKQSYSALSVEQLAQAAGVTKATLYYHFAGKGELFVAAVCAKIDELLAETTALQAERSLPTRERLKRLIAIWYGPESDEYNAPMMEEAVAHLLPAQQQQIHAALALFNEPIIAIMAEGIAAGELRANNPRLLTYAFQQVFADIDYEMIGAETHTQRLEAQQQLLELFLLGAGREGEPVSR
jgi:TetR/AcrR family transcriptional regulator, mexJK operon transcriptional repressor